MSGAQAPDPRRLLAVLSLVMASTGAHAADACRPAPLGERELYARGDFNSWGLDDSARFTWACDRYELVGRYGGPHDFKIADENWSRDADFGAPEGTHDVPAGKSLVLARKGTALAHAFGPATRLVLSMPDAATPPTLTITDCPEPPSPLRTLALRGPMAFGNAGETRAFQWSCDAYFVNVKADAPGSFLLDGVDAAGPRELQVPAGEHTVRVSFDASAKADVVIGPKTYADPRAAQVADPVARSLRFDSRSPAHKSPFGAVPADTPVTYALDASKGVTSATLVVESRRLEGNQEVLEYTPLARVPMTASTRGDGQRWTADFRFDKPGVYGWWFDVEIAGRHYAYGNNDNALYWTREKGTGGVGAVVDKPASASRIRRFRQTVFARDYTVPAWAADAVYYYIFPDRFRNGDKANDPKPGVDRYQDQTVELHKDWNERPSKPGTGDGSDIVYNNDFFGGDIAGIVEKLDHLRALGVNTLYITPMFAAASNHKYDTSDYRHIDPHFGTDDDFARLCREAGRRGIRVLPDTSLNHVGTDSTYFDRFGNHKAGGNVGAFQDARIHPESPYASWFKFDPAGKTPEKQYVGWVGVADLPEIDKSNPSFRAFAYGADDSITRTWLRRGAAGWRMDVAPWVPDDFWREWRRVVRQEKGDALTVAETWFDASKFFTGDEFDSTMNYIFRSAVLDYAGGGSGAAMADQLEHLREAYPPQSFHALMNLLSSHDAPRTLHVLGDVDGQSTPQQVALAKRKFRMALFFQMTYPGAPAVYYGDEVGVTGAEDPMNRGTYPWPDLGGHPDTALEADVKTLIALRSKHPVLRHGTLMAPLHADEHVVVLARREGREWAVTATNNDASAATVTVELPEGAPGAWTTAFQSADARTSTAGRRLTIALPAYGALMATGR